MGEVLGGTVDSAAALPKSPCALAHGSRGCPGGVALLVPGAAQTLVISAAWADTTGSSRDASAVARSAAARACW